MPIDWCMIGHEPCESRVPNWSEYDDARQIPKHIRFDIPEAVQDIVKQLDEAPLPSGSLQVPKKLLWEFVGMVECLRCRENGLDYFREFYEGLTDRINEEVMKVCTRISLSSCARS